MFYTVAYVDVSNFSIFSRKGYDFRENFEYEIVLFFLQVLS
jgi:hypothetical protein